MLDGTGSFFFQNKFDFGLASAHPNRVSTTKSFDPLEQHDTPMPTLSQWCSHSSGIDKGRSIPFPGQQRQAGYISSET
jgi:hypothetical protein